jgi:hypothetical protein
MIYRPPPPFDPDAPIIVIDIGNTTTSVATWHGGELKTPLSIATDHPLAFEEAYAAHVKAAPWNAFACMCSPNRSRRRLSLVKRSRYRWTLG